MRSLLVGLGLLLAAFLAPHEVQAQAIVLPCVPSGNSCIPVSAANPLPTTAAITANTTTTCSTTQVLFALAGKVSCDSGFTYAGAGGQVVIPSVAVTGAGIFNSAGLYLTDSGANPIALGSGNILTWTSSVNAFSQTYDVGFARNAAGVIEINNGVKGTVTGGLKAGALSATLPTAAGTNVVCNTPGTSTALSVQVAATGCAVSSARFKDAILAINREKAFETILALQPVSYFYKPEFNMGGDKHVGFTAEQVATVDPSLVTFEEDGVTPHAVKYGEMAPLLVAAIQQLKADNDNLRAAIESIQNRLP